MPVFSFMPPSAAGRVGACCLLALQGGWLLTSSSILQADQGYGQGGDQDQGYGQAPDSGYGGGGQDTGYGGGGQDTGSGGGQDTNFTGGGGGQDVGYGGGGGQGFGDGTCKCHCSDKLRYVAAESSR